MSDLEDAHTDFAALLDESLAGRSCVVADVSDGRPLGPADASVDPVPQRGGDDMVMLVFTSGTTANPKGCMIAHNALACNAYSFAELFELTHKDAIWDPLPFFHLASLVPLGAAMTVGGRYLSMRHFEPDAGLRLLGDEDGTILYSLFPAVTQDLIHHPEFSERRPDGVRVVCNIAPEEVQRRVLDAFPGAQLVSGYGITECTGTVAYNWPRDTVEQRIRTCGQPFAGIEAAIADLASGKHLEVGEQGELLLRGPTVFKGYFADPENTQVALDDDGWLHTGDVCSLDADGRIIYHGRDKDMLKVGGENVGALEIESALARHPAVKTRPGRRRPRTSPHRGPGGIRRARRRDVQATEVELIEFCQRQIARFKVPRYVRFVTEWPMSATKIQKFRLREQLAEELAAS